VYDFTQTIAALSTPPGESGIAVVRMSGDEALAILTRVFVTVAGAPHAGEWEHRRLYRGRIVDEGGEPIDEVMVAVMRAPDSYTGEDVVEVSCHGSTLVASRLLGRLFGAGARAAEPGEFTRRAFLGGKMDLIQAEAVADLIHARSDLQRRVAQRQLEGALSRRLGALADDMVELLGTIEANIDFIEEDIDVLDTPRAIAMLDRHQRELAELLASAPLSRPFRDGYRVAVAGPVNAGKSSLFNRLLGEERAIVTEIPGTTRDLLREAMVIDGLVFVFHDTAGLRPDATDRVESIGIDLATDAVRNADAVVFVVDGTLAPSPDTVAAIHALDPERSLIAVNKRDRFDADGRAGLDAVMALESGVDYVTLSALSGEGVTELKTALVALVGGERLATMARQRVVLNERLVALLWTASVRGRALRESLEAGRALELMAVEARETLAAFEEATGRSYQSDVLDVIFSRFCIGK
jgi:tRNA modification GTPase